MKVCVVGLGAMGGGMARSLLKSPDIEQVTGYDLSVDLVQTFYDEAKAANKAPHCLPEKLELAVDGTTDVVVIVLVNERQCESVCFGDGDSSLTTLLRDGACVVVSSTVSAAWAKSAEERLASRNVQFVDSPISGGAVRANRGEISIFASGHDQSLQMVDPLFRAMGKEVHIIEGGVGMGSTVKMVHQLLAGVHIVVAAEALALAAKAGLDVAQMYDIVCGAAGSSFMFKDRGARMIEPGDKIMSALAIFVKDLDIVYSESKRLMMPVPLASAALQQFISGASLGLSKEDDSSVVKVYETLAGIKISESRNTEQWKEGNEVGDIWVLPDGTEEVIQEVGDESRHHVVISNEYTRVLKVKFSPEDTTAAHRHGEDSLYFFLVEDGLNVINHIKGSDPACDCMEFGECRFGGHSAEPLVHKITNKSDQEMFCIDAEILKHPPVTSPLPLFAAHHQLIKERHPCRVYLLSLQPGEDVTVSYPFFHLSIVLRGARVKRSIGASSSHPVSFETDAKMGDEAWQQPTLDVKISNVGEAVFEQFIVEWK